MTAVAAVSDRRRRSEIDATIFGTRRAPVRTADLKVRAAIPLSYRVEDKMRLSKDRRSLKGNDSLTLAGIPPEDYQKIMGEYLARRQGVYTLRIFRLTNGIA